MSSPQAHVGLQTCQHAVLAVAAAVTTACVTTAVVTAIEAAVAVAAIDAADVTDVGCSKTLHCVIQV